MIKIAGFAKWPNLLSVDSVRIAMPSLINLAADSTGRPITASEEFAQHLGTPESLIRRIVEDRARWYTSFEVPKANGGVRIIRPPKKPLRAIQRTLLSILYRCVNIPRYLHGGIPRRSIFTHARAHVGRVMVATLDVKSFFPSTSAAQIENVLRDVGFDNEALHDAVALTTLENELPQGAPTSSLLANLAFGEVDAALLVLCRKRRLVYSRYVDDIAISGRSCFRELKGPFIDRIESGSYRIAEDKVCFMGQHERQSVTGLVVNAKMRPNREFNDRLKADIRLCISYGPGLLADVEGISIRSVKAKLNGRVAHLAAADAKLGRRLSRMLFDIQWTK